MTTTRVQQNRAATLTHTFVIGETATDPSPATATVTVTSWDGTVLVDAEAATRISTGVFTFLLTSDHTATLDALTVEWTSSIGIDSQPVEIVGGFLFELAELRAMKGLTETGTYTTVMLEDARVLAEQALEVACDRAFVPRFAVETLDGNGGSLLLLKWPDIRSIRSVTVDGVAYTDAELAGLAFTPAGMLTNTLGCWPAGASSIVVAYEHGRQAPPARAGRAARLLARRWLINGPIDDRASTFTNDAGTSYSLVTAGVDGAEFDIPEVNAVVQQYGLAVTVA